MKTCSNTLRLAFAISLVMASVVGTQAQLTNNPLVYATTNTVVLVPTGSNGFGVAILGFGMPSYTALTGTDTNQLSFIGQPMGRASSSDTTNLAGTLQWYVVGSDAV